ncbi:MAG: methyltransferase [Clostridiales bacterium]|nr:methyltransferase [Clostridiales bacterium]
MNYENYMELYEAVYFFDRINCCIDNKFLQPINKEDIERLGINESVYNAILRILVVNNLLDYDGSSFMITKENMEKHQHILDNIINKDPNKQYTELFNKAINESQFFFDSISESEYEIYSRCDFPITFKIGKEVVKHINLANSKVLELGGNSGGLGTALLEKNEDCLYTVVDTKIPCIVGNEFKKLNNLNITFIEGNVFNLILSSEIYDYIIVMNLLHDFDDIKCLNILSNCTKHYDSNTKFLIIEDVLTGEFEPKEIIMHGLRLSVECRGGKQRTKEELAKLFLSINYGIEKTIKLNNVHTMLVMGAL